MLSWGAVLGLAVFIGWLLQSHLLSFSFASKNIIVCNNFSLHLRDLIWMACCLTGRPAWVSVRMVVVGECECLKCPENYGIYNQVQPHMVSTCPSGLDLLPKNSLGLVGHYFFYYSPWTDLPSSSSSVVNFRAKTDAWLLARFCLCDNNI